MITVGEANEHHIVLALSALAGFDKIAFPEDYAKGVMYGTVDCHDNMQYHFARLQNQGLEQPWRG